MNDIFTEFQLSPNAPVTVQVVDYIKRKVLSGELRSGQELPSRRKLAVMLGINPNTVQKIYRQLEEESLIETLQASKSLLAVSPERLQQLKGELVEEQTKQTLTLLKSSGLSFKQVIDMVTHLWEEE